MDAKTSKLLNSPHARLPTEFGPALRFGREQRSLSQLALSLKCGVSQRHISFLESGRASPSRQIVLQLAEGLDAAARQRDELLLRAGYAPLSRRTLGAVGETESESAARNALAFVLQRHEPFPAVVLNALGYIQMANPSALSLSDRLMAGPIENLTLSVLDPGGLRPYIVNWQEVAGQHLLRIRRELHLLQEHPQYQDFLHDLERLCAGLPDLVSKPNLLPDATMVIKIQKEGLNIDLLSMIVQFGVSYDSMIQELRVECFYPANDASRAAFHQLVGAAPDARVQA